MIYFDLDGPIRDLIAVVHNGKAPLSWDQATPYGTGFLEYVDNNLDILTEAPATEYYNIIKELPFVTILTHQPKTWIPYTEDWINKYFKKGEYNVHFVNHPEEKFDFLKEGDILVEDYPMFKSYSQIALVEYPYNQHVTGERVRIRSTIDMFRFLGEHLVGYAH
jgi:hypothetical protein